MNPESVFNDEDTMRPEYDFDMSKAVRGKYAQRIKAEGTNVALLDADVYEVFRDSEAVNNALRGLIELSRKAVGASTPTVVSRRSESEKEAGVAARPRRRVAEAKLLAGK